MRDENWEIEIDIDEPVFTSSVVSRLLDIPVWVLKQFDSAGIVSPPRKGREARLYSKRELKRLKYVWYLKEERNVTIDGLRVILEIEQGRFE